MSEVISVETAIKRLKENEVWPFWLGDVGFRDAIHEDKFYGFYDCGGVFNKTGYDSQEELVQKVKQDNDDYWPLLVTTKPENLGLHAISVLSGREFINQIYSIIDYTPEMLDEYGSWSGDKNVG